jgi:hypothetical protein
MNLHEIPETDTMKTSLIQLLSVTLLAVACLGTAAEVYKWTDSTGRVHYSDKPDGDNLQVMNVKSKPTDKAALAQARQSKVDAEQAAAADLRIQEQINEEANQNAEIRTENCRRATEAVTSLRNAQRLYVPSQDGERRYLNDDEIADRIKRAETDKSKWCSKT